MSCPFQRIWQLPYVTAAASSKCWRNSNALRLVLSNGPYHTHTTMITFWVKTPPAMKSMTQTMAMHGLEGLPQKNNTIGVKWGHSRHIIINNFRHFWQFWVPISSKFLLSFCFWSSMRYIKLATFQSTLNISYRIASALSLIPDSCKTIKSNLQNTDHRGIQQPHSIQCCFYKTYGLNIQA